MSLADTIFALASAPGRAGVAVVRVSGARAGAVLTALAGLLPAPRQATLATLAAPGSGEILDKALVLWMPGPGSYTGEDVAELHLHGGRAVLQALFAALSQLGARPAEPGEFTRRAVLNGKMDLTAAEAVADLVDAETALQRRQALRQMEGELARLYGGWRARLTQLLAHMEATIDFTDEDLPRELRVESGRTLIALAREMEQHLAEGARGARLRAGLYAAIVGAPNAGKSSLLNRLAQREVAIVTPVPGTTRDVLEVPCEVVGYPVTFADTAGLRETADVVEAEGVRRARHRAREADIRILLFDATQPPDAETLALRDENAIVVFNKCDLPGARVEDGLQISALTGEGFDALLRAVAAKAELLAGRSEAPAYTRVRHQAALEETQAALQRAMAAASDDQAAEDVRLASRALGRVTGAVGVEDLLDVIFRDFCIGK